MDTTTVKMTVRKDMQTLQALKSEWLTVCGKSGTINIAGDSLSRGEPVIAVVPVQIRVLAMPPGAEMRLAVFLHIGQCLTNNIVQPAPYTGRDGRWKSFLLQNLLFQPTRPSRGATWTWSLTTIPAFYFNPRAPRGARHGDSFLAGSGFFISIHAPLAGRDWHFPCGDGRGVPISTHAPDEETTVGAEISTHAPLRGATHGRAQKGCDPRYFNPRAPYGARL